MEDYKNKYEGLLNTIKDLYPNMTEYQQEKLQGVCPELAESEDEKIKKELIEYHKIQASCGGHNAPFHEKYVSWLEKQGEKINPYSGISFEYNGHFWGMCARDNGIDILLDKQLFKHLERGEQKPTDKVKPKFHVGDWVIDKQGIVHQISEVIENVTNHTYGYDIVGGGYFNDNDAEGVRLWTIEDAKDGDVLVNKYGAIFINAGSSNGGGTLNSYCYLSVQNKFCIEEHKTGSWFYKESIKPATKEQCDLLFQKMKEAGYEWDAEKKELKKIDQSCYHNDGLYYAIDILENTLGKVEGYQSDDGMLEHKCAISAVKQLAKPKPAWSEKMGSLCLDALGLLRNYGEGVDSKSQLGMKIKRASAFLTDLYHEAFYPNTYNPRPDLKLPAWSEEDEHILEAIIKEIEANKAAGPEYDEKVYDMFLSWLKSLKDRYTWKPSDEQIEALRYVLDEGGSYNKEALAKLLNDIKNFRLYE